MRLFRSISLLLLSALLSACGREPIAEPVDTRQPILFSPSISVETKTGAKPDDPTVLISEGSAARVFGTRIQKKAVGDDETANSVFSNTRLHCDWVQSPLDATDPTSSIWSYSPLRYWKEHNTPGYDYADYYFAAVYPFHENIEVSLDSYYYLSVSYRAGLNQDLMVARAYRRVETTGVGPVNLSFKHATSAVRFLFGKSSSSPSDNYTLEDFQLTNLKVGGTLRVLSTISEDPGIAFGDWNRGATGNLSCIASLPLSVPYSPANSVNPDDYVPIGWYYMVPQYMSINSAVSFSVSYNGQQPVTTVLSLTDCDGISGLDCWNPNCVYNYFITLTQSGLNLTVKAIPWDEVQVTTDPFQFEG